ncbi:MAG: mobA, partial [Holophagaceae bacterium]|nr:mobA [Holophagaceae bacterium]
TQPSHGLLLLTGGQGSRMGEPKHAIALPGGGSWSGHLVRVFEEAFPGAQIRVLGNPVPDRPELPVVEDPRQGPGVALRVWAALEKAPVDWWWIAACDQMRWTPAALADWHRRATGERAWTLGRHGDRLQYMGSWLPGELLPALAERQEKSVYALVDHLPHRILEVAGPEWMDLDTPEERRAWESSLKP